QRIPKAPVWVSISLRKPSPSCRAQSTLNRSIKKAPSLGYSFRTDTAHSRRGRKKSLTKFLNPIYLRPMAMQDDNLFRNIISHSKEYGFIFPSSEIYDGLSAVYDYGQNGAELKNNIKEYWWKFMTMLHDNIVGIDAAI